MLERSTHGPMREVSSRGAARLSHASLLSVIKSKPEGIAKGGKRPLGGVGLGAFKRKLVGLPRGRGLPLLFLIPPAQS